MTSGILVLQLGDKMTISKSCPEQRLAEKPEGQKQVGFLQLYDISACSEDGRPDLLLRYVDIELCVPECVALHN